MDTLREQGAHLLWCVLPEHQPGFAEPIMIVGGEISLVGGLIM